MDLDRKPGHDPKNADETAEDERLRWRQNIGAAVAVIVLLVACWWVLSGMDSYRKVERCLEAGRRNCVPIDTSQP